MAVPNYTEDLTDIDLGQSTTGWSAYGGGGAGLGTGADFAIQSTLALDKQITNADKGAMHNDAAVSFGASDHIIGWIYAATPGILDTLANGGKVMAIGTSTGNFNKYALEGSDTRPQGGNKPYAVRYSTAIPSPGSQVGSPGATPTFFGGGLNTTGTSKGVNLGIDAFRYGTGAYITAGDAITPATLDGFATQDELTANKWGIMFRFDGIYQWQGRFVVGQDNTGSPTAAHFDDQSGAVINVSDTPHSQSDFSQFVIDHASTFFHLKGATFLARGTNNPGSFLINNASATSPGYDGVTWRNTGTTQGHVNVPHIGCLWVGCDQIDQNGGTYTGGEIQNSTSTAAVLGSNPGLVTAVNFVSSGSGHGYECDTAGSYNWSNTDSGYTGTRGSNLIAGSGSADAMFYNNSGGAITLSVTGGGQSPSVRNAAGSTTTVINSISWTITGIPVGGELTITDTAPTPNELFHVESTVTGTEVYAFDGADAGNAAVVLVVPNTTTDGDLEPFDTDQTLPSADATLLVDLLTDRVYANP